MMTRKIALLVFAVLAHGYGDRDVFILSPQSSLAPLNSSATFTCRVHSDLVRQLLWEVDGGQTSSAVHAATLREKGMTWNCTEDSERGWLTLELTAAATVNNNHTEIQCVAFTTAPPSPVKTPLVTLTVYDHPSAPSNVSLSPLIPLQLNLSWTEPYSHPNITLSYTIIITSLDTQNGTTTGPSHLKTVLDTSSNYFIFKLDIPSCDTYEFRVAAVNEAGASEPSDAIAGSLPIPPSTTALSSSLSHALAIDNDVFHCNISFLPATTCPNREYPITRYILHLHNTLTNSTSSHPLPPPTFPDLALVVYLNSSDGAIVEDSHYVYHIIVESRAGSVASESREMVTTDVSHVTTSLHYPTLTITCHFLPGSPAHGCYVSLTSLSLSEPPGTSSLSVMVPRSNSSSQATTVVVLTQQPTCYRLEVYDWEGGREVGQIPIPLETTDLESGPSCEIGNGTTREPSHLYLVLGVVGGVVLVAAVMMIFLVGLGVYYQHRTRSAASKAKQDNYYSTNDQGAQHHQHQDTLQHHDQDTYHNSLNSSCVEVSFTQSQTHLPPFPPPPLYEQAENFLPKGNVASVHYSSLVRGDPTLPTQTPHNILTTHDPNYSTLNQFPEYAYIEAAVPQTLPAVNRQLIPLPPIPHDPSQEERCDFINSLPSAGTTL